MGTWTRCSALPDQTSPNNRCTVCAGPQVGRLAPAGQRDAPNPPQCSLLQQQDSACQDYRIRELPGWGQVDFGLYGGYITVDAGAGRALYFIMAESLRDSAADPLVVWLNGGPGCSSLGGGFLSELGPWYPTKQKSGMPYRMACALMSRGPAAGNFVCQLASRQLRQLPRVVAA